MYNIPTRVIVNADPSLLGELGAESTTSSRSSRPTTTNWARSRASKILAGNDNTFLRVLEFGGAGVIVVATARGRRSRCARCGTRAQENDLDRAREIDAELTPIYQGSR